MRTLEIHIASNGSISIQTQGFTGKTCMDAIPLLQTLCDGHVVESAFMEENELRNTTKGKETETCHI